MTTPAIAHHVHEFDADEGRCSLCYELPCEACGGCGNKLDRYGKPTGDRCRACGGEGVDAGEDDSVRPW